MKKNQDNQNPGNDESQLPFVMFPEDVFDLQVYVSPGNKFFAAFEDLEGSMTTVFFLKYLESRSIDGMDHREAFNRCMTMISKQRAYYLEYGEPSVTLCRQA